MGVAYGQGWRAPASFAEALPASAGAVDATGAVVAASGTTDDAGGGGVVAGAPAHAATSRQETQTDDRTFETGRMRRAE
jgi:hypothetical protein